MVNSPMLLGNPGVTGHSITVLGDEFALVPAAQTHQARAAKAGLHPDACPHGLVRLAAKS